MSLRAWSRLHRWTSLVCMIFLLLLCIAGLPLIFHHEIGRLTGAEAEAPAMPADTPMADLDRLVAAARAQRLGEVVQYLIWEEGFLYWMLRLHTGLFTGIPGKLFLGAMGLLFVIATISGAVLYGPFARHGEFGTVRSGRSARLRWLDLHNIVGGVTLSWVLVVGTTGVVNTLAEQVLAV